MRRLYFSVTDVDVRKQLIEKHHEIENNLLFAYQADVREAHTNLKSVTTAEAYWPLQASLYAVPLVVGGAWLLPVTGAISGAVVAYFVGRFIEDTAKARGAFAIKAAEENLRDIQAATKQAMELPFTFSYHERRTGNADEPRPRVAV